MCLVDEDKSELYYNIEKILKKRWHEEGYTEYLVKWERDDETTWEPGNYLYELCLMSVY